MSDDSYRPDLLQKMEAAGIVSITRSKPRNPDADQPPDTDAAEPTDKTLMERRLAEVAPTWGTATAQRVLRDTTLVKDVLPAVGLAALYGQPGAGKSVLTLHLAVSVATGTSFFGKRTRKTRVLYLALEGTGLFTNRVAAHAERHGFALADLVNFGLVRTRIDLRTPEGHGPVLEELLRRETMKRGPIGLVIVDTLARAFGGGNENSAEDMAALLYQADALVGDNERTVLLVHHMGKDASLGMRGHSSLLGAVDAEIKVTRSDTASLMTVTKARDFEDGAEIAFAVESVVLGQTDKGEDVTAAVAVGADLREAKAAAALVPVGRNQRLLLQALRHLGAEPGIQRNPAGPGWPGAGRYAVVPVETVVAHAKGLMDAPAEGERDRRARKLIEAIQVLVKRGMIGRNHDRLWLIREVE